MKFKSSLFKSPSGSKNKKKSHCQEMELDKCDNKIVINNQVNINMNHEEKQDGCSSCFTALFNAVSHLRP